MQALLNKITMDNFGKITPQIAEEINRRKKAITLQVSLPRHGAQRRWAAGLVCAHLPVAAEPVPSRAWCPAPVLRRVCPLSVPPLVLTPFALQGFIDQIFDKALSETTFSELYSNLVAS